MLNSFSEDEQRDMVGEDGTITVTCEFCSSVYTVDPGELGGGAGAG
jgi:molecular chaperone Hsp33